jgi:hypothetical protein
MNKLLAFCLIFFSIPAAAAKIAVTVGDGSLQPGTTAGFNVSSGTVANFKFANATTTGTFTLSGATVTNTNSLSSGTVIDTSTRTFRGGEFSGTRNDNSTATFIGAVVQGTRTDSSTTTLQGAVFNGTKTDNSTTTFTASNNFGNQRVQNISSATIASDATRYSQNKLLGSTDATVSASSATSSATYGKSNIAVTHTVLSSASKIKIMATFSSSSSGIGNNCEYKITKNGANITTTGVVNFGSAGTASGSLQFPVTVMGSDLPATTGNVTYEVSFRNLSGGITCTVGGSTNPAYIVADEINGL